MEKYRKKREKLDIKELRCVGHLAISFETVSRVVIIGSLALRECEAGSGTGLLRLPLLFVAHLSWRTHGGRRVHNSRHQLCSFFFPRPAQQLTVSTTTTTSGESTRRCERARSPLESAANTAAKPLPAE